MQIGSNSPIYKRRLNWLKRNKKYWTNYASYGRGALATERLLLEKMIKAKLYPPNTTLLDVSFERLIHKVRKMSRPRKVFKERKVYPNLPNLHPYRDNDSG